MKKVKGFNLVEVLITLGIVGVIATLAAPPLATFLENRRLTSQAQIVADGFSVARMNSISLAETTKVCWNNTNANVTVDTHEMTPGEMIVIADSGGADRLLKKFSYVQENGFNDDNDADDCITFDESGRASNELNIGVCRANDDTDNVRSVKVNFMGRATVSKELAAGIDCK